jgi:DNA-binding transcriptional ArsR family regulator
MKLPSDPVELERLAGSFRALAHPTRLRILVALRNRDVLSPVQLLDCVEASIPLANVAHHTRELAALGLLTPAGTRPSGGALQHFYRLSPLGHELLELVDLVLAQT